jgi:hypothetical protein
MIFTEMQKSNDPDLNSLALPDSDPNAMKLPKISAFYADFRKYFLYQCQYGVFYTLKNLKAVFWIRIRLDPELFAGSRS